MKHLWIAIATLLACNANAGDSLWTDIQGRGTATSTESRLQQFRLLGLDETGLKAQLSQVATYATNETQARAASPTLNLPLPDGSFAAVTATPTDILAPDIATAYPDIQTWKVFGTDGKIISGTIDITPLGFHAMLDMASGDTLFIDPRQTSTTRQYLSFSKKANWEAFRAGDWSCSTREHGATAGSSPVLPAGTAARSMAAKAGETLQTYRIAMAATGEYTDYYGSQNAAYSSIVTIINRINQVYERDLSIRLLLVSGTNIVYPDPEKDPYSNNSPTLMLSENVNNLNKVIGDANFDIGHVLATDGGGLASVATACGKYKSEGMTGLTRPEGDAFIIDYVAHELGHQIGATHTFNGIRGACFANNREALSAYEPGSGSTIMAYTGLCEGDNLQADSDSMMHSASIQQIQDYMHDGSGALCAGKISLANSNPTANAGANYTIPAGTPFILSGSGLDINGDTLSYSWEQVDAGTAAYVNVDLVNNALIRAHLPTARPVRTIPQMSDLLGRVQSAGEVLPATERTLNFRLLVRDGRGGTAYDDTLITVKDTGSNFAVTSPTSTAFVGGTPQTVTWTVAGTDQPSINCSTVDIAITTDNGNTFTDLLTNTPNDGSATVTLPLSLGSKNHIRVKCSNNIFFALSATSPAKARTSNIGSSNTAVSTNSTGGGGSAPPGWIVVGILYVLYRLRKGVLQ